MAKLSTPQLTRVLNDATTQHQPPVSKGIRPKLRYAHQGGMNPPVVVVHGNHVLGVKDAYKRYLEGVFRQAFQLIGTPLRVQFNQGENPFVESETRKQGEGLVSMRRRKNAQRAALKARKQEQDVQENKRVNKTRGLEIAKRTKVKKISRKK
jgi:GTP-binding protein